MTNIRRDFTKGKMNLDADERLLPDGEYRIAENISIINQEGSDVGSIRKSLSNKLLSDLDFGSNPVCLLGCADESRGRIFWHVKSDTGCFLVEYSSDNDLFSFVLKDTRPIETRVLKYDENFLITGTGIIITDQISNDLYLWTDDQMEPCCINIERSKLFGENNFTKEDIYLVKKPPVSAIEILPINIASLTNNLEERFLSFAYRYKYLDGEYSAISTFTNYAFIPKSFDLNFYTLDNVGMVNAFNAMQLSFNTGEKQVTDIELLVKESNSNTIYIIERLNKVNEGYENNVIKNYIFSNNKTYISLPANELFRTFDAVPLKAKSLAIIGNIPVFGNFVEGYDMLDNQGDKVFPDYDLSLVHLPIESNSFFNKSFPANNRFLISNPQSIPLNGNNRIILFISLTIDNLISFEKDFFYILPENYSSLVDLFNSNSFSDFLNVVEIDIQNNYNFELADGWTETIAPTLVYENISGNPRLTLTPITFTEEGVGPHVKTFKFESSTSLSISEISNTSSIKTNRDIEVGLLYEDDFGRKSPTLTSNYNSIYVPQQFSIFKNKIQVSINNKPPYWATKYRFTFKSQPLDYQTIYINKFYNENFFVWAKLEAENKDKVKVGDILIIKKGPNPIEQPLKIKVLEIKEQAINFITGNFDSNTNEIIEEAGFYMKIRPEGFSMGFNDYQFYQSNFPDVGSPARPIGYLDLFTTINNGQPEQIEIPSGSSIRLVINSSRQYDAGWYNATYDKLHFAQRDYSTIGQWFNEIIINKDLFALGTNGDIRNYRPFVQLVTGTISQVLGTTFFEFSPTGKLYLQVQGLELGGSGGRRGYVRASIEIRTNNGFYVFETEPKKNQSDVYYENSQTFNIVNGVHQGNLQNQNINPFTPAVLDLDFFNCYAQGNGVESYKIRDGFNTNFLNIDLKPSSTIIGEYKQIRRSADLTFGNSYSEGSGYNGINVFNLANNNLKELLKEHGSIQKLIARNNDIVVFQEYKTSYVLFNKTALYKATGDADIVASDEILGEQIPYGGEHGVGKNPESIAVSDFRIYSANPNSGTMQRLSIDGFEEITYGMTDFFRDNFIKNPNSKKIGGYDPYHDQYFISLKEQGAQDFNVGCGFVVIKNFETNEFTYFFNLNELLGTINITYDITDGDATIVAEYGENTYVESNVSGNGAININRTNVEQNFIKITITPVSESVTYIITNNCPIGQQMTIKEIVIGDVDDASKTITNRYKWGNSVFYTSNDVFLTSEISRFETHNGIEGVGRFPARGELINIQSFSDTNSTIVFNSILGNKIGYLVSSNNYNENDLEDILNEAEFLNITDNGSVKQSSFLFERTDQDVLYLIWDYRNENVVLPNYDVNLNINCFDEPQIFSSGNYLININYGSSIGVAQFELGSEIGTNYYIVYNNVIIAYGALELSSQVFEINKNEAVYSDIQIYVISPENDFTITPTCIS